MEMNISPERIARFKRCVPKGMIKVVPLEPLKGLELRPLSPKELGLPERKAA